MSSSASIPRHVANKDPLSFYSLRHEAIEYAQEYSGEIWTDYNAHDPGVTILEQLCYGLTELNYQTDFSAEDLLAQVDGSLNYKQLALALPEQVLPARACTIEDYQQLLLDSIDEVDRVWISPVSSGYIGLYNIELQLTPLMQQKCLSRPSLANKIIDKASHIYSKNRNLAEDVAKIEIVNDKGYQLIADIHLVDHCDAEYVLAQIYSVCHRWVMGELKIESYEEQLNAGRSLEQILTGPIALHGRYRLDTLDGNQAQRTLASLYSELRSIEEIEVIDQLALVDVGDSAPAEQSIAQVIRDKTWLQMPGVEEELRVNLKRHHQSINVHFETFTTHLEHSQFKQYSMRHTRQEISSLYQVTRGHFRQTQDYQSIQQHFPSSYNLSANGIGAFSAIKDKANANQLRGYLLVFEQLMANFSKNIGSIKSLFSIDQSCNSSYQFYTLDSHEFHGIEYIYPAKEQQKFDAILAEFDHFHDRKGRVLDYLLALYGEELDQSILRQFNFYDSPNALEAQVLESKYHYLNDVVAMGRDRGGAFDYRCYRTFDSNIGGFQHRLSYHLGMPINRWPYTSLVKREPLEIVSDSEFERVNYPLHNQVILNDAMEKQLLSIPLIKTEEAVDRHKVSKMALQLQPLQQGVIGESFFKKGVDINNYKLIKRDRTSVYDLYLTEQKRRDLTAEQLQDSVQPIFIGTSSNTNKVNRLANILCEHLAYLNRSCEGVYVVEHLLLRPMTMSAADKCESQEDSISCQISIIFPGFTARCADLGYRQRALNVVQQQCPAHIYAECFWLDFGQLCEFEQYYMLWLELRRDAYQPTDECQRSAEALLNLLQAYRDNGSE
ncbi:hypothetical protein FM037_22350 [Shewanella psychropiezotolerans]|uniref:Uncharacterized protein n=1 Tax=Shewanella psychropiezotolerans TaxID=2593655 RepID=A0ABX5X2C9_9GAMM|nr:hypothetical protein [Shewanella psychropiezotolerans]QDO85495.1 hypothetical protein FM037_22350 [Shewanella psychropiezotolerans]